MIINDFMSRNLFPHVVVAGFNGFTCTSYLDQR